MFSSCRKGLGVAKTLSKAATASIRPEALGFFSNTFQQKRNTTILCVRKDDKVVMVGDGQVTLGSQVVKPNVIKIRRINERVIGGFAGATADAMALLDALEVKLGEHPDQIVRAAVELAKSWRTDKFLRKLDAMFLLADSENSLEITGAGDVIEPHDGIMAIGSGSPYALAAARALIDVPGMDARKIAEKSVRIAADIDIYSNHNFTWQELDLPDKGDAGVESRASTKPPTDSKSSAELKEGDKKGDASVKKKKPTS
ncbi:hypothetical protein BSKO_11296 [Bryopsis sp. KO-2023]|nr:hypothetical protein BSKO_11296 [Bryopsis sp. KO-2023]